MNSNIVVSVEFFDSFIKLPKTIQEKVVEFFEKFIKNPQSSGFNLEKLPNKINDKQLYSARVDLSYRTILYKDDAEMFHLLWIDNHDDAYYRADNKSTLFENSNWIPVYSTDFYEKKKIPNSKSSENLFARISSKELMTMGVPIQHIHLLRSIKNFKSFEELKTVLPEHVYNNLEWIAVGIHVREISEKDKLVRKDLVELIETRVLQPSLDHPELGDDYKKSILDTRRMLEKRKTTKEVMDFVDDALDRKRGKQMHDELQRKGITTLEDIEGELKKIAGNTF